MDVSQQLHYGPPKCKSELDSKVQAVVHGSVDATQEPDTTTFEAIEGMANFDFEIRFYWVSPKPKDKSEVVYDELSDEDKKKFDAARFQGNRQLVETGCPQSHDSCA